MCEQIISQKYMFWKMIFAYMLLTVIIFGYYNGQLYFFLFKCSSSEQNAGVGKHINTHLTLQNSFTITFFTVNNQKINIKHRQIIFCSLLSIYSC